MLPLPLGEKHLLFVNSKRRLNSQHGRLFILKFRQMISVIRHRVHREKIPMHDHCRFLTLTSAPPPKKKNCNILFLTQLLIKIDLGFKILVPPFHFFCTVNFTYIYLLFIWPQLLKIWPQLSLGWPQLFYLAKEMVTTFLEPERTLSGFAFSMLSAL